MTAPETTPQDAGRETDRQLWLDIARTRQLAGTLSNPFDAQYLRALSGRLEDRRAALRTQEGA